MTETIANALRQQALKGAAPSPEGLLLDAAATLEYMESEIAGMEAAIPLLIEGARKPLLERLEQARSQVQDLLPWVHACIFETDYGATREAGTMLRRIAAGEFAEAASHE